MRSFRFKLKERIAFLSRFQQNRYETTFLDYGADLLP
jgi:hypothetical protein